jgi:heme/copper-type cytochrome/quinol oxidase subunit 2
MFLKLLTVLFIGLKLTGYIDWNWFWVLSPMIVFIIIVTVSAFWLSFLKFRESKKTVEETPCKHKH